MANFAPLNVIIEDESEEEVDDSKEIQIEEALKLYQTALKLHSQGPEFYDEAEAAYEELFRSEIFTYPESLSESQWIAQHGDGDTFDDENDDAFAPEASTATDGTPSTLPQILYLAYKNHGQFRLDRLKDRLARLERDIISDPKLQSKGPSDATTGLKDLVEALDRDETDLELWRTVSRVSEFLGSRRIARFCVEAVLDTDDGDVAQTEPLGLEESFAIEQLAHLLRSIQDDMSESQSRTLSGEQTHLINALRKYIDPCPYLPKVPSLPLVENPPDSDPVHAQQTIGVPLRTWASAGKAILHHFHMEAQGQIDPVPGSTYYLHLSSPSAKQTSAPTPKTAASGNFPLDTQRDAMEDAVMAEPAPNLELATISPTNQILASPTEAPVIDAKEAEVSSILMSPQANNNEGQISPIRQQLEDPSNGPQEDALPSGTSILPTRKRSSETAELPDSTDVGRVRSKRIKARGSLDDPSSNKNNTAEEWARWYQQQLQIYVEADGLAFESVGGFQSTLMCRTFGSPTEIRNIFAGANQESPTQTETPVSQTLPENCALQDLKKVLDEWDLGRSKAFLYGDVSRESASSARSTQSLGFSTIMEQSAGDVLAGSQNVALPDDLELDDFVAYTKAQEWSLQSLAFEWVKELLRPRFQNETKTQTWTLYEDFVWPSTLKEILVQILVANDEHIFSEVNSLVDRSAPEGGLLGEDQEHLSHQSLASLVHTIFEIHLDVYGCITNPSSEVDIATRTLQHERLFRWASVSSTLMSQPFDHPVSLSIRFLWCSIVCTNLTDPSANDWTVTCYQDMIRLLKQQAESAHVEAFVIELPNNAVVPEISVAAAEKEISRLKTMDFFTSIFSADHNDPFAIIEKLEPLLDLTIKGDMKVSNGDLQEAHKESNGEARELPQMVPESQLLEALKFLDRASISLRLFLWQRLRDAYSVINYPPQILQCNLRCFEMIIQYLFSSTYARLGAESRHTALLHWLHRLDELLNQILGPALSDSAAFDCIDDEHIRTSITALAALQRVVYCFAIWEDSIRVGQTQPSAQVSNAATKAQLKSADKFRDMIVKTWTLQYLFIREAIVQNRDLFKMPDEDLLEYLRLVHRALGLRTYCSLANKIFLKLAKSELLRLKGKGGWDVDMPQIIFDLHGLKISSTASDVEDHVCEAAEIDKHTALEILDLVMLHVHRLTIKDLLKSDLKLAVDKLQQIIKVPRLSSPAKSFNKRLVSSYLKSPINPIELYRSLKGIGGLNSAPVRTEGWNFAEKGWYFLLGYIALIKFKSQKRIAAGSLEDLENAKNFFTLDLEFDTEKWETWYRLAQAFDTLVEEGTTWTAEKLEHDMDGIADLQRKTMLCYSMAVAVATRYGEASFEDTSKMADLYADYGTRIYSATREPFSMRAFSLEGHEKHYNGAVSGMYKGIPFRPLQLYPAWKFSSVLLKRASVHKPNDWLTFYTLAKVSWKMHDCDEYTRGKAKQIHYQSAIDAVVRAIECVPEKRDSRHPDKDPILEPHYKLVSFVHKLARMGRISAERGCHLLSLTPYARKVIDVHEAEQWTSYVLQVLKAVRSADKSNWHHRMVARAAHIIYDEDPNDRLAIVGAKHELTQQIFTKTMTIQVWKPDNERAGRHFVYTGRYVRFFVLILLKLRDKEILEALARRIRKRASDFVSHTEIWRELSSGFLLLLRDIVHIPEQYDEQIFKSSNPEEFSLNAGRIEIWAQNPATKSQHLDILRDTIEFKKLNNNLLKATIIEDLIADIYAAIYETNAPTLKAKETAEENRVRMRVDNILSAPMPDTSIAIAEPPPPDPMAQYKRKPASVTRRELIRRAEALMTKPAPIATPKQTHRTLAPPTEPGRSPGIAVVVPQPPQRELASVPGSVHDSADDESELSEVEEMEAEPREEPTRRPDAKAPLFPNLFGVKGHAFDGAVEGSSEVGEEEEGAGVVDEGDDVGPGGEDAGAEIGDEGGGAGEGGQSGGFASFGGERGGGGGEEGGEVGGEAVEE